MAQLTAQQMEGFRSVYHGEMRRRDERSVSLQAGSRPVRLWDHQTAEAVKAQPEVRTELR